MMSYKGEDKTSDEINIHHTHTHTHTHTRTHTHVLNPQDTYSRS